MDVKYPSLLRLLSDLCFWLPGAVSSRWGSEVWGKSHPS